jgi:hypothetical protein
VVPRKPRLGRNVRLGPVKKIGPMFADQFTKNMYCGPRQVTVYAKDYPDRSKGGGRE